MFLDRSWPIRGGAADIYMPLITIWRTVTEKFHINEVFYSYRKKDPVNSHLMTRNRKKSYK